MNEAFYVLCNSTIYLETVEVPVIIQKHSVWLRTFQSCPTGLAIEVEKDILLSWIEEYIGRIRLEKRPFLCSCCFSQAP